jgi:pyruvate/2-oxoglutarate dehydrogenase complex dihydrolipoamide acyltransferase (E2) component
MQAGRTALKLAIDLLRSPSQVRLIKPEPLPDGVELLLRIAAGEADAARSAAVTARCSPKTVRRAAAFFIEQILFASDADSYRVLGVNATASAGELRRNAALLLRWLLLDRDAHGACTVFASRVTGAWNDLKTSERRAAYDAQRRAAADPARRKATFGSRSRRKQLARILARRRARQRDEWLASQAGGLGFLWRAFVMLLYRPVQRARESSDAGGNNQKSEC